MNMTEYRSKLERLAAIMPERVESALGAAAKLVKAKEQMNLSGGIIKRHTGRLARSPIIKTTLKPLSTRIYIDPHQVYKAVTLNEGKTIVTRKAKALKFKINGRWVTVQRVHIPKREFVGPSFEAVRPEVMRTLLRGLMGAYKNA